MKPSDILIAARALIDTPDKWTKGCYARNARDEPVESYSRHARCFCTLGAMFHASGQFDVKPHQQTPEHERAEYEARRALGAVTSPEHDLAGWNDAPERTHAEVLAAYDTAIAALVAEGR